MIFFDITDVASFDAVANRWLPEVTHFMGVSCELNRSSH